ncbi:hypothetical protein SLE2022_298880 [Rubroshorea leprosula]
MNTKPLSLRTLISLSSFSSSLFSSSPFSLSVFISHFSTLQHFPSPVHSSQRRHEEESRQVRVSVWWDFENCHLPAGANVFRIAPTIAAALRANGIKGPIQITAFGDVYQLSRANQEALSATGIDISHVPQGGKNSADRSLLVDLMHWVSQNPPPAHLFLISGDRDFAGILHRLRMSNYNILLASNQSAPSVLCSAASIMWHWNSLVKGENVTGKYFNQPPDGPYGSWYGHYKVPLEDPFSVGQNKEEPVSVGQKMEDPVSVVEQPACSQTKEFPDGASDSKLRPVPKAVMKQIRQILSSFPEGISIGDLHYELKRSNVHLDRDLYGHKKFSRFLLSMPHILKLRSEGSGQFLIRGVTVKAREPNGCMSKENGSDDEDVACKPILQPSPEVNAKYTPKNSQQVTPGDYNSIKPDAEEPSNEVLRSHPGEQKAFKPTAKQLQESQVAGVLEMESTSEVSFFRKFWQRWFGHDLPQNVYSGGSSEDKGPSVPKNCIASGGDSERVQMEENSPKKIRQDVDHISLSSSIDESTAANKTSSETSENNSEKSTGFLNRFANWCRFWRSSKKSDASGDQVREKLNQINSESQKHKVFSEESFWNNMETFLHSSRGSNLVLNSKTREEMAQNLLREGPSNLKSLSNTDLLHLVDLLILDKKWVAELPSQTLPFRITRAAKKSSALGDFHAANELSSIFSRTPSSHARFQPECDGEKKFNNVPQSRVSSTTNNMKSSEQSRSETLADCRKLVREILKKYPQGYNVKSFKKLFLEKYGYSFDEQTLGYRKLTTLLEMMPGVKIESNYIFPSNMAPNDSDLETAFLNIQESNVSHALGNSEDATPDVLKSVNRVSCRTRKKSDYFDSLWAELGPVSNTSSNHKELQSVCRGKTTEENKRHTYPEYEPCLSDDELSDSERETSTSEQAKGQGKPEINDEGSSLIQILDSWYGSNKGADRMNTIEKDEEMIDCSRNDAKPNDTSELDSKLERLIENQRRKHGQQKSYNFVANQVEDRDSKLVDDILGGFKKSSESRIQS